MSVNLLTLVKLASETYGNAARAVATRRAVIALLMSRLVQIMATQCQLSEGQRTETLCERPRPPMVGVRYPKPASLVLP